MKSTKLLCLALVLMFIAAGCKKKEPQSSQQSPGRAVAKSAKPTKPLQQAAADGDLEQIKLHISLGANVNAKTNKGLTPIYAAIGNGHKQAVELLIASGADVNAKTESGWTPLHSAAISGHKDIAELLIAGGADVNAIARVARDGWMPLHYAVDENHEDMVELLLANGADVNGKTESGWMPLHCAATKGLKDIAELLIASGADVNTKDKNGHMPLNAAIDKGHKALAELLIASGADVNAKGRWDQTPLYTAIRRGYKDMAKLLIANGADVNVKDQRGWTPLYVAQNPLYVPKHKEYKEIIELLRKHGAKGGRDEDGWSRIPPKVQGVELLRNHGAKDGLSRIPPKVQGVRGIVYDPDNPAKSCALIGPEGRIVRIGDTVNGTTIIKINKKSVEFEKEGKKYTQTVQRSPSQTVTKPAKPPAKPTKSLQQAAATDGVLEPHGPLSEIYKKYNQAIKKWDTEEIKKYASDASGKKFDQFPEDLKRLSETERELALEIIECKKSDAAKDYEVIHQKIESDKGTATLYLRKKDDFFPYGLVFFVKENGAWKIEKESWSNKSKKWDIKPPQDLRPIDVAAIDISFVQKADGAVDIKVTAKNNGEQNISELSYTFTINECEEKGGGMPTYNFGPGKESIFDFSYAYDNYYRAYLKKKTIQKPFELKMVLVLDPKDELKESNEGNNKITKTFYLKD